MGRGAGRATQPLESQRVGHESVQTDTHTHRLHNQVSGMSERTDYRTKLSPELNMKFTVYFLAKMARQLHEKEHLIKDLFSD